MNRLFRIALPVWLSSDGRENMPPKNLRRPGGSADQPRTSAGGPWLVIFALLVVAALVIGVQFARGGGALVDYSFFRAQLEAGSEGNVAAVTFSDDKITGEWKDPPDDPKASAKEGEPGKKLPKKFTTVLPPKGAEDKDLITLLQERHVAYSSEASNWGPGASLLGTIIVTLMIGAFLFIMLRRSVDPLGPGGMAGSFIRSPAKRFTPAEQHNTFDDVAGMEQSKKELQEVVEFLKNPAKFQRLGAQIPKGVLLMGPPGTGKTLLARATAGEAGVPFYSINGSEFIQMFVGVGASRVRDMFRTAKENSPCILFIDEIDAVGRVRGAGVGGGHDEREQTLNQILSEMDGFQQNEAVIVVAATNRPDVLDPALLRPGRFDRHVPIDRPTREGRLGILKVHTRKVPLADDVKLETVAAGTIGFSGADLRNLVNEAALNAAREGKNQVDADDFDAAKDRVLMGPKREEILNEKERAMTAYHEAGHALVAWLLPELDPVHKVTIVPRGRALGVTQLLADEERHHIGEQRLHSHLVLAMGGRSAEKMVFDEYSAGAENDIQQATDLARRMVAHWGMSEAIGPVAFHQSEEHPFLGKEIHELRQFSEETAHVIDQEVQRFIHEASTRATEILATHRDKLEHLAQALLEREALDRMQMTEILGERADENAAVRVS
ncbi:MAG TPA: ATP-dependent zinc metalloprotease FtsH [Planctomycetaceae bacterium]|nr:ATP-dependent zinc metalloprotease FtsH [Planctomycetaceae bacterium]